MNNIKEGVRIAGNKLGIKTDDEILDALDIILPSYERLMKIELNNEDIKKRKWRKPSNEENPYGAITFITDIKEKDQGILKGKKVCIKDVVEIAGVPMLLGTSLMEGYVSQIDATVIKRILEEGGHIVAKTTTEAFASSGGSQNSFQTVRSPLNHDYMTGGSSSGNAAALVSEYCDVAIGTDEAGSIRIPSSWTGIYGLKPTYGLVPFTGIFSGDAILDHAGPMARNIEDLSILLEAIAGSDQLDGRQYQLSKKERYSQLQEIKNVKIGIVKEGFGWNLSEKDVDKSVYEYVKSLDFAVEEVSIPMHRQGIDIWMPLGTEGVFFNIVGKNANAGLRGIGSTELAKFLGKIQLDDMPKNMKLKILLGYLFSTEYNNIFYIKSKNLSYKLKEEYDKVLSKYDLLVMPTTPRKAAKIMNNMKLMDYLTIDAIQNTCPFNVTGHPALSIPCCKSDGLPIGIEVITKHFNDKLLLDFAFSISNK